MYTLSACTPDDGNAAQTARKESDDTKSCKESSEGSSLSSSPSLAAKEKTAVVVVLHVPDADEAERADRLTQVGRSSRKRGAAAAAAAASEVSVVDDAEDGQTPKRAAVTVIDLELEEDSNEDEEKEGEDAEKKEEREEKKGERKRRWRSEVFGPVELVDLSDDEEDLEELLERFKEHKPVHFAVLAKINEEMEAGKLLPDADKYDRCDTDYGHQTSFADVVGTGRHFDALTATEEERQMMIATKITYAVFYLLRPYAERISNTDRWALSGRFHDALAPLLEVPTPIALRTLYELLQKRKRGTVAERKMANTKWPNTPLDTITID